MAKPNADTRSSKIKRVISANVKAKSVVFQNSSSDGTESQQRGYNSSGSGSVDPSVALANGKRDSSTAASEQLIYPTPILSENGDVIAVSPNPAFVANEEPLVVNSNADSEVVDRNPASVPKDEAHVKHDRDSVNFQLAIYIAMAHSGLVLAIAICYGVGLLLKDYWTPIQWAILISMPLHRIQGTLVEFWMRHIERGLVETIFAIPVALLSALLETARDVHAKVRSRSDVAALTDAGNDVTFSKLCDWLFSFGTCTLLYENLGLVYTVAVACGACALYWSLNSLHSIVTARLGDFVHRDQGRRESAARVLYYTRRHNSVFIQSRC